MRKIGKFLYWIPRIFSILFILFLAVFSLDVFESCNGFLECTLALFMHNIPVLILAIILIIAWKHELVGAVSFALGGLLYIAQMVFNTLTNSFEWYMISWSIMIAGPAFILAFLFYLNWKKKR